MTCLQDVGFEIEAFFYAEGVGEFFDEGQTSARVQAWDVGSLIEMSERSTVYLLRIDIEGAELTVFNESASWLHRVRNICIELHGKDCVGVFFGALKDFDYEFERSGELTICRNLRPRKSPHELHLS